MPESEPTVAELEDLRASELVLVVAEHDAFEHGHLAGDPRLVMRYDWHRSAVGMM